MVLKNVSNMDVKKINRANTLRCILENGRISQPELAQKLSLSWPSVLQNVRELVDMGLVQEIGISRSTGGRKAKVFAPIQDARIAVGMDITQNHIGFASVNLSGDVLDYARIRKPFAADEEYFDFLQASLDSFIQRQGYTNEKILGTGISLPGIVDEENHSFLSHVLNLRQVSTKRLEEHISYPCKLINDANAAGYAEIYGKKTPGTAVYLSLSNSVGGAILQRDSQGGIFTGTHLRAGEFGHMTLVPNGKRCYCGKDGCVDAYCSARVLSSKAENKLALYFERLRSKESELSADWEEYLDHLAIVVNNLHMVFDSDVIIGGYVGSFMEDYVEDLKRRVAVRNTFGTDTSFIKLCKYRQESSAVGAALLFIEQFIEDLE